MCNMENPEEAIMVEEILQEKKAQNSNDAPENMGNYFKPSPSDNKRDEKSQRKFGL